MYIKTLKTDLRFIDEIPVESTKCRIVLYCITEKEGFSVFTHSYNPTYTRRVHACVFEYI